MADRRSDPTGAGRSLTDLPLLILAVVLLVPLIWHLITIVRDAFR
jgi:hypothetical protein